MTVFSLVNSRRRSERRAAHPNRAEQLQPANRCEYVRRSDTLCEVCRLWCSSGSAFSWTLFGPYAPAGWGRSGPVAHDESTIWTQRAALADGGGPGPASPEVALPELGARSTGAYK